MSKRCQPSWNPPEQTGVHVLKLYNSLTRQKEVFVPLQGNKVTWYSCGPTVYDASHMGHARSYITFDILRRVLTDYFGYDILYVMNITDIDDKIIKRARQNYLFEKYIEENHSLDEVLVKCKEIMEDLNNKTKSTSDPDKIEMYRKLLDRITAAMDNLEASIKSGNNAEVEESKTQFLLTSKDQLSDWLDNKLGHTVTDNAIFSDLPKHWEEEFHKDMEALNILKPDILTRVSEYIPEIVEFIEKIIKNGMGYVADGSVYFDVANFDQQHKHHYAKLVPEAYGDTNSLQEGEGVLCSSEAHKEKRSPNDFALWKKSKAGEPSWDSPWGKGRPGWHIECSAMASSIFGSTLDIHTGGIDLKFPHHDNEIAQSEAHFGQSEWVKYFLHSGHLTIAGCKMSKSLKNFVSVKDALFKYTARQLRFAFLYHGWGETLDYSQNTMVEAVNLDRMFNEFFLNVKNAMNVGQSTTFVSSFTKWEKPELNMMTLYLKFKQDIHISLCDNIDTRSVIETLRSLVIATNGYLHDRKPLNINLLQTVSSYITRILIVFGVINEPVKVGFPISNNVATDFESIVLPYLTILSEFREKVRTHARTLNATEILKDCDRLRDDILPNVGVRLEDKEGEPTAVKLVDKETILKEKEAKKQAEAEKQKKREERQTALAAAQAAKEELMKIPPSELFKRETDKYSKFDDKGMPTHDREGKELSKGQFKKLQKLHQQQEKRYEEYLSSLNS